MPVVPVTTFVSSHRDIDSHLLAGSYKQISAFSHPCLPRAILKCLHNSARLLSKIDCHEASHHSPVVPLRDFRCQPSMSHMRAYRDSPTGESFQAPLVLITLSSMRNPLLTSLRLRLSRNYTQLCHFCSAVNTGDHSKSKEHAHEPLIARSSFLVRHPAG